MSRKINVPMYLNVTKSDVSRAPMVRAVVLFSIILGLASNFIYKVLLVLIICESRMCTKVMSYPMGHGLGVISRLTSEAQCSTREQTIFLQCSDRTSSIITLSGLAM